MEDAAVIGRQRLPKAHLAHEFAQRLDGKPFFLDKHFYALPEFVMFLIR